MAVWSDAITWLSRLVCHLQGKVNLKLITELFLALYIRAAQQLNNLDSKQSIDVVKMTFL